MIQQCTRFATEFQLRRALERHFSVRIIPSQAHTGDEGNRLAWFGRSLSDRGKFSDLLKEGEEEIFASYTGNRLHATYKALQAAQMNTRSSSCKASDTVAKPAKPAKPAVKKALLKEVPAAKQVTLPKHPTPKRSSTKHSHVLFEADVEEMDMIKEMKKEMEARLRAELTVQVTTHVAIEIARLEEERAAEVLRLETQYLKKKQKKVYNMLEKHSLQERDGRGTTPATSEIGLDMEACLEYTDKGGLVDYPVMMSLKVYFNRKLKSYQTVASSMLHYSIFDLDQVELYSSKAITQFLGEFNEYTVKLTAVV
ncbi:MAG: hypothetical protein M1839_005934 [Geoglossum umbratile]|nr:MAG: hypothetical protein M1839_005934 [Geoglossum umbratile]